ncbi:MAG: T9SS type A sorting domain-containing protein [Bacteroidota bacterium]
MRIIYTFIFSMLCAFTIYAQPTDNAADPPARDAADVIGIYGDTYANADITNYDPNWGQSGHTLVNPDFDPGTGMTILAYPTFNYQGTELNAVGASAMEFLHIDVWVPAGTDRMLKVSPIDNSGVGPGEVLVEVALTPGAWNSVDLPKSAFTDMSWNSVFQMKFDGQFNGDGSANTDPYDVYLDNIYFWKNPTASGTDATLSDLQVDGATIPGFGAGVTSYNFGLPGGTVDPPQITMATTTDPAATATITQATTVPGSASVEVTAANGTDMLTYTVSFLVDAPTTSPDSPTQSAADVISIYSDAYTTVADINYDPDWGQSGHMLVNPEFDPGTGNFALAYPNFNYQGTEFATLDASAMEFLHLDIWVPVGTDRQVKISPINNSGEGPIEVLVEVPITPGEWNSVDLPKSAFTDMTWASIGQMKFDGQFNGDGTANTSPYNVYIDNLYFYKDGGGMTATEPTVGAPDPTIAEADVISLFSDVYTDVTVDTWNTEWSDATFEDVMVDGNPTKKYTALGFNGIETVSAPVDASEMLFLNMDIWTPNMTELKIKLVDFLGDGFEGANGDSEAEITVPVSQENWMNVSIPLSDFTDAGLASVADLNQYIITSEPFGTGTLYMDNVFFSKVVSSSKDLEVREAIKIYPNPVLADGTLNFSEELDKIEIISLQGQLIRSARGSSIDLIDIATGSYLVRLTSKEGGKQISKIIVK